MVTHCQTRMGEAMALVKLLVTDTRTRSFVVLPLTWAGNLERSGGARVQVPPLCQPAQGDVSCHTCSTSRESV